MESKNISMTSSSGRRLIIKQESSGSTVRNRYRLPFAPPTRAHPFLSAALFCLLMRFIAGATPEGVVYAGTSGALYAAFSSHQVRTVYLTGTITLDRNDWAVAVSISRNVTVSAPPQYEAIAFYITLDCSSIAGGITVQPGGRLTFRWLELVNYVEEIGQAMLLVSSSPGGVVAFEHVVQRRAAGLGGKQTLSELLQLPRLEGAEGGVNDNGSSSTGGRGSSSSSNQTAFYLPRFCFNSSRGGNPHCENELVYVVDVATRLPPGISKYFAGGLPLGSYDMRLEESVQLADVVVDPNCLPGATPRDCVVQQLKLLAIPPVLIKAKPSASNLVKIVASLAILTVSVLLFLYFRRHYRTYQERRARRMRRIKEALGMGPEAHGVMFNGLDGEVPDWQIMPMPVGYAQDEGNGTAELHQDSNIRNLIKDISNRPNRQLPLEYAAGGGDGAYEVRIDFNTIENCPIAEEVCLRRSPVPSAFTGGAAAALEAGGGGRTAENCAELPPAQPSCGTAIFGGKSVESSGADGAAAAVAVHVRPLAGSGTMGGGSYLSASATSVGRNAFTELAGPLAVAGPTVATAALPGHSSSGGLRVASTVLETLPTIAATKAGLDVLMASRVAAAAAAAANGSGSGGGRSGATITTGSGAVAAAGGFRSVGSSRDSQPLQQHPSLEQQPRPHHHHHQHHHFQQHQPQHPRQSQTHRLQHRQEEEQPGEPPQQPTTGAGAGAGTGPPAGRGPGPPAVAAAAVGGPGGAAASRNAADNAAADVESRLVRSKGSEDGEEVQEAELEADQGGPVASLIDELEELRRDIMAGVNDTQLQIMSVVGSGAFGTVYRGQWQGLEVAVKTVVFSASSENRKRALQEAALCQSINHQNIVATYAVDVQPLGAVHNPQQSQLMSGQQLGIGARNRNASATLSNLLDWRLYIVQEYCDGGPLRKLVQSQYLQTSNGPNMLVICEVALELAQALAHLHSKNIIHGDLNPNNVLLKRDASSPIGFRVKVADFGLSVMMPLQKTHMSNLRLGTLYYIAPETCFRGQLGYAADVFSLGVMLWELYHGRLAGTRTPTGEPRYQPDFPDFPAACPPDYRKLAHRCLQKQPHNRLHSSQVVQRLSEMIAAFRAAAAAAPAAAPLPPLPFGGPDETALPLPPPAAAAAAPSPFFTHQALAAAAAAASASCVPTPTESRHRPTTPTAPSAAGAGTAGVSPEIAPW